MIFAQKVWRLLVAIKDGLTLMFLLLFFLALYGALTARPGTGTVREGALLLRLDGEIVEEPEAQDPFQQLMADAAPVSQYGARDVVRALRLAAKDGRIKAVVLDLSLFTGAGFVNLAEIGSAMDTVRAAKKPVLTFATAYADDGLLLAAHASESWIDPLGGAFVTGPGGQQLYYAGLFDKLKLNAHIFRVGTYKSAVEPFTRDSMSDASREQSAALYGALFDAWKANVAAARPKAAIGRVTADPVGWLAAAKGDAAEAARAAGLIDKVGSRAEFGARVAALAGEDMLDPSPGGFAHTAFGTFLAAHPAKAQGKAIGVVTVAGEIVDGDAGPGTAGGDRIAAVLDEALERDLAALVVRVDSPGGSILASEQIRAAIARHKARGIPVVVSMANIAASGGYWVSTPADRIFAEPGTVTGSIGIFAIVPTFEGALGQLGVTSDGVRTTPLSGQPDLVGGLTPQVEAMLQANIEHNYGRFLALVGKARGKTPAEVDRMAQGRVWDGGTARQLGLVDQFGGLDAALAFAAGQARLKPGEWHRAYLGEASDGWSMLLNQFNRDDESAPPSAGRDWAAMVAERQMGLLALALRDAQRLLGAGGVQAYCLECPARRRSPTRAASHPPIDAGVLAWLARAMASTP
jgi:protease-4